MNLYEFTITTNEWDDPDGHMNLCVESAFYDGRESCPIELVDSNAEARRAWLFTGGILARVAWLAIDAIAVSVVTHGCATERRVTATDMRGVPPRVSRRLEVGDRVEAYEVTHAYLPGGCHVGVDEEECPTAVYLTIPRKDLAAWRRRVDGWLAQVIALESLPEPPPNDA